MKIGIYSGTFDPIHVGHAIVSNYVAQCGLVDEVWLMPSRLNPLKLGTTPVADSERLQMGELVAAKCRNVRISDYELHLPYPSYTYTTLTRLRTDFPEHQFMQIIGSDNWLQFDRWRNHEEIIQEFGLIIYPRPGYELADMEFPKNVYYLKDAPKMEISSTYIREGLAEGKDMNWLVPEEVLAFIQAKGLYSIH